MSGLFLSRIPVNPPELMRFAKSQGLLNDDDGFGYTLHAWLTALFGEHAPKPFRYFERRQEVLGYGSKDAAAMLEFARDFSNPVAYAALDPTGLVTKAMPTDWSAGKRLGIEVMACPVSRKDGDEKDAYLRALDRLGDNAPSRATVYCEWFRRQWGDAVSFERLDITGFVARRPFLRRSRKEGSRLVPIERPQVLFEGVVNIRDAEAFSRLLTRGIGRHRSFGLGMVNLSPPR